MTPKTFLENFGYVINARLGVSRLREMVYALAVSGSLCPQRQEDGTGLRQLEQIAEDKEFRIRSGAFKRSPKLEGSSAKYSDSLPRIPRSWAWSRLVDLGEINPRNDADDDSLAAFAPMNAISELHNGPIRSEDRKWASIKKGFTHFADGDVIVAKITPCFENGKGAVLRGLTNGIGAGTTELHVVRPLPGMLPEYIYVFLRSPHFKLVGESHMTGTAGQKRLSTEYFALREFPLPPLEEQKRIVAKVDELMRLCDRLEAQQQTREKLLPLLSRANHTRFIAEPTEANLGAVFHAPGGVQTSDLLDTVLSLAYQAKLVPRLPGEGSGQDLLESLIADYLSKRGKAGQVKIGKTVVDPRECSGVFVVPKHWAWTYLDVACDLIADVDHNMPKAVPNGVPFISAKDLKDDGTIDFTSPKLISEADFERLSRKVKIRRDDIVYSRIGARLGKARLVAVDTRFLISYSCCLIRPNHELIDKHYLQLFLDSSLALSQAHKGAQSIGVPDLGLGEIKAFRIPLPPILEQRRIVARIRYMMLHVARLEKLGTERTSLGAAFAKAAVAAITSTEFTENERMKPPKTEVVTALKVGQKPKKHVAAPLAALLSEQKAEASAKTLWQLSGLEIDAFYRQLKTEMANGWLVEQTKAFVREAQVDSRGWSDERIWAEVERYKSQSLEWRETSEAPRKWWTAFEEENRHKGAIVLRLIEELVQRRATITDFFLAFVHSNTDNIEATLSYLDYTRKRKLAKPQ